MADADLAHAVVVSSARLLLLLHDAPVMLHCSAVAEEMPRRRLGVSVASAAVCCHSAVRIISNVLERVDCIVVTEIVTVCLALRTLMKVCLFVQGRIRSFS
jgi:hypothetical protein